ncbi:hypothetical protein ACNKHO_25260 [Shigella flexneri]
MSRVTIWSDVAGDHSADLRQKRKDALLLPLLRLDEASELARLAPRAARARSYSRFPAATLTCNYAVATRRIRVLTRIDACWIRHGRAHPSPATTTFA